MNHFENGMDEVDIVWKIVSKSGNGMSRGAKGKGSGHHLFGLIPWIQLTKLGARQQPHVYANFCFLFLLHRLTLQCNGYPAMPAREGTLMQTALLARTRYQYYITASM